jgi:protein SCO1/2
VADFKGKAVMLFFGFTQCPDICPTALVRAAEIRKMLGADGERLQVIFVTVDPERDSPVVLKAYTQAFDPSFLGLYGDPQKTSETAKAFKAFYRKVPTGSSYTMDHSAFSYVFDPAGKIRLALRHEQSAQECAEDLRKILIKTTA